MTVALARNPRFWTALDQLIKECLVAIDRARGSHHPDFPELVYPLDYGYLEGSKSGDAREIDVWIGSLPCRKPTAIAVTIDLNKRDSEIKLLLGCTDAEIDIVSAFHNFGSQSCLVMKRGLVGRAASATVSSTPRIPGSAKGRISISPDFYAPLPDDALETFEN